MALPPLPEPLRAVAAALPPGTEAWLVGGAVRDLLLGRPLKDVDLAVRRGGLALAREVADRLGAAFVPLDVERGVGRIVWERQGGRLEVDVADFRAAGLEGDLRARDLTVNAMALSLGQQPQLVDPAGGAADLEARRVRLLGPEVLADDPLRTLRAVRFSAQLGFALDAESAAWIRSVAPSLATVSPERVRDELWKTLVTPQPAAALRLLDDLGLLAVVVPEVAAAHGVTQSPPHRHDVWEHILTVVAETAAVLDLVERVAGGARDDGAVVTPATSPATAAAAMAGDLGAALAPYAPLLRERLARPLAADRVARGHLLLAALFHDLGKPATRSVGDDGRIHFYGHEIAGAELTADRLTALKLAQGEVQHVTRIVRHHMRPLMLRRPEPLPPRTLHRFHRAAGDVAPEVCLLSIGDNLAKGEQRTREEWPTFLPRVLELLEAFFFRHDEVVAPPRLVRGGELVAELGLPQGAWVSQALRALAEAQAAGDVSTRDEALAFARNWLRRQP
jgi:poly(A) polymerase